MSLGATVLLCVLATAFAAPMMDQFTTFKTDYKRQYATIELEAKRMAIFADNLKFIDEHNAKFARKEVTFEVGVNRFADLSLDEFVAQYNGFRMPANRNGSTFMAPSNLVAPTSVDWRTKGLVTPVKDQGQCGSCWAFSATGSLEGQHFKKIGSLISLSEQNLVDCSTSFGDYGCRGGLMDNAFDYIKAIGGCDTEASYPYEARDGQCRFNPAHEGAHVTGHHDIPQGDEDSLMKAVASVGPVSVAIDASHQSFQLYKRGMYTEPRCSSSRLDHGVLVVGYGETEGKAYWLVKNSWSENWGNDGYIWMARNNDNMCGIATSASYPLV